MEAHITAPIAFAHTDPAMINGFLNGYPGADVALCSGHPNQKRKGQVTANQRYSFLPFFYFLFGVKLQNRIGRDQHHCRRTGLLPPDGEAGVERF